MHPNHKKTKHTAHSYRSTPPNRGGSALVLGKREKIQLAVLAKPSLRLQLQQGPLNKALGRRSQPPPLRPGPAVPTEGGGGKGRDPHLHGLRRLPDQATCLRLLQGLRPSHPQRARGLRLAASEAGSLRAASSEEPSEPRPGGGCGAALQMETAACISGSAGRNTSAAASPL